MRWIGTGTITIAASLLVLALVLLGFAPGGADEEAGHAEPMFVEATCLDSAVRISWEAVADSHLAGYNVYLREEGNPFLVRANEELILTVHFTIPELEDAMTYEFLVEAAYDDGHLSALSIPAMCAR